MAANVFLEPLSTALSTNIIICASGVQWSQRQVVEWSQVTQRRQGAAAEFVNGHAWHAPSAYLIREPRFASQHVHPIFIAGVVELTAAALAHPLEQRGWNRCVDGEDGRLVLHVCLSNADHGLVTQRGATTGGVLEARAAAAGLNVGGYQTI